MLTTIASCFAIATLVISVLYGYVYVQKKQRGIQLSPRSKAVFTSLIILFGTASLLITQ
ncbi:hypothetical protein [Exiguobacterium artemiae]|uniref:hypothetical protein n=1 Tax=Exiguobacterium artemiae TaxID=340145 RepID=UPI0029645F80|nr:hypothetical protein [Exiguobacterium sibiricum]MDW2885342.1 hypothetical protein [Exiguobacterium sibiricum]